MSSLRRKLPGLPRSVPGASDIAVLAARKPAAARAVDQRFLREIMAVIGHVSP